MTRTEELYLELNPEIGRAVQTHSMVEAAAISAGRVGPWAYYLMLAAGDAKAASKMQARAMLMEMMNGRR